MAILHLMVGLPCSGKTTWAKQIELESGAIRLTPDEWQTRLYGNDMHRPDHERVHDAVEAIMSELADRLLRGGYDVILDFGFWSKAERDSLRAHAEALGVDCMVHYAGASRSVLEQRMLERTEAAPADGFVFGANELNKWIGMFEKPDTDELAGGDMRQATDQMNGS